MYLGRSQTSGQIKVEGNHEEEGETNARSCLTCRKVEDVEEDVAEKSAEKKEDGKQEDEKNAEKQEDEKNNFSLILNYFL